MKYEKLFHRGRIGNLDLKNRIVMSPMGPGFSDADGNASDRIIRYYEERAKGGAALIITGITCVDDNNGRGEMWQLLATHPKFVQGLHKMANAVHRHDTKIFVQLHHPGREVTPALQKSGEIVAPSAIPCPITRVMPREMTTAEVEALVGKFVQGAVICKTAGIDGVELHAGHGYLLNQFVSPMTNKRTDKYGGDFFNRMRILADIIIGIRYACGPQYPVSVRISADEFNEEGIDLAYAVKMARYLESLGIAAINVSCGTYASGSTIVEPYFRDEAWKKHLAKEIKKNVNIPVIAVNTIKHPETAEALLQEGVSDFVSLGRAHLADPEFGNKAKEGKEHLIRKCMGCMFCFKSGTAGLPIICNANPVLGEELIYNEDTLKKNGNGRTVAVIGGGPGGMQAAIVLARRGFKPVIFEKSGVLGGSMNQACMPPHKGLIKELIDTLVAQLKEENVEVRLNTEANVDAVKALDPYGVIIAAGGKPVIIPIPGADGENVYTAQDVVGGKYEIKGKRVVVVGAGITGLETAEVLAPNNDVTIVELTTAVGEALYPSIKLYLTRTLGEMGVNIKTNEAIQAFENGKVILRHAKTANMTELEADVLVFAAGVRSDKAFINEFYENFDKVTTVGDASATGLIGDALREANSKAYVF